MGEVMAVLVVMEGTEDRAEVDRRLILRKRMAAVELAVKATRAAEITTDVAVPIQRAEAAERLEQDYLRQQIIRLEMVDLASPTPTLESRLFTEMVAVVERSLAAVTKDSEELGMGVMEPTEIQMPCQRLE